MSPMRGTEGTLTEETQTEEFLIDPQEETTSITKLTPTREITREEEMTADRKT